MSNLNNISKTKEMSLIDFILSFWFYKKVLLLLLLLLLLLGFLLESFIPKKNKIDIELKSRDLINYQIYPSKSMIYEYTFGSDNNVQLNFFYQYFEKFFLSHKNLINFSKLNKEKYDFDNYIKKNKTNVFKPNNQIASPDFDFTYRIILPQNIENKDFYKEYLFYSLDVALENFKNDLLLVEQKKISTISEDIKTINTIIEQVENNDEIIFYQNKYASGELHLLLLNLRNEKKNMIQNLNTLKNFNHSVLKKQQIFEGPTDEILNEKYYNLSKIALPLILSLIIYIVFILYKFVRLDHKN